MEELVRNYLELYGLTAVFTLMVINGLVSMPPSEVVLTLAGAAAAFGEMDVSWVIGAGVLGNFLGTSVLYVIGRRFGSDWVVVLKEKLHSGSWIMEKLSHILPGRILLARLQGFFSLRRGYIYTALLRCVPAIRSIISIPAGMVRMPAHAFAFSTLAGMLTWTTLWVGLGFLVGESWKRWGDAIAGILLLTLLILLAYGKSAVSRITILDVPED